MDKIITTLIKKRLGIKGKQKFYFKNQKKKNETYSFVDNKLVKHFSNGGTRQSSISFNWLMSKAAKDLIVISESKDMSNQRLDDFFSEFKNGLASVHIANKRECKEFCKLCDKYGIRWFNGKKATHYKIAYDNFYAICCNSDKGKIMAITLSIPSERVCLNCVDILNWR